MEFFIDFFSILNDAIFYQSLKKAKYRANTKSLLPNDKGDILPSQKFADKPKPPGICLAREEEVMIDGGRNCIR